MINRLKILYYALVRCCKILSGKPYVLITRDKDGVICLHENTDHKTMLRYTASAFIAAHANSECENALDEAKKIIEGN